MKGTLKLPSFSSLQIELVEEQLDTLLDESNQRLKALEQTEQPDCDNFVHQLDLINDQVERFWSPVRHLNSVMNSDEIREVYNTCKSKLSAWQTEQGQNRALYENMHRIAESEAMNEMTVGQQKAVQDSLRGFQLGGVALDGAQKDRFKEVALQLSKLSSQFQDNVLDATKAWDKLIELSLIHI